MERSLYDMMVTLVGLKRCRCGAAEQPTMRDIEWNQSLTVARDSWEVTVGVRCPSAKCRGLIVEWRSEGTIQGFDDLMRIMESDPEYTQAGG